MPDEVAGISRVSVERSTRDFPRREPQQQGRHRPPRHQPEPETKTVEPPPDDDLPRVGSRLNVRA